MLTRHSPYVQWIRNVFRGYIEATRMRDVVISNDKESYLSPQTTRLMTSNINRVHVVWLFPNGGKKLKTHFSEFSIGIQISKVAV